MTEETGSAAVDASSIQTGAFDVAALGGGGQIAGYRVEAEIGHGGMATVYRALDVKLGRRVALKILAPRLAEDDSFRQRFIHESRAAAAVDHPHIVPVFEAGESGGVLFIAMRYVGTGDVRTLLERQGRLPVDRAVAISAQVASALDAAHAPRPGAPRRQASQHAARRVRRGPRRSRLPVRLRAQQALARPVRR